MGEYAESLKKEYEDLKQEDERLDRRIEELKKNNRNESLVDKNTYMKLLHDYNDVKDAAQIMIGALANMKGETVKAIHKQFNLPMED